MVVCHFISSAGKRNIHQSSTNSKMWGGTESAEHSVEHEADLTDWKLSYYLIDTFVQYYLYRNVPKITDYRRMLPDLGRKKKKNHQLNLHFR